MKTPPNETFVQRLERAAKKALEADRVLTWPGLTSAWPTAISSSQLRQACKALGLEFWQIQAMGKGLGLPRIIGPKSTGQIVYEGTLPVEAIKTKRGGRKASALTLPPQRDTFLALDVETTGLKTDEDRIIELGFAAFVDGRLVGVETHLIQPDRRIPRQIQELTGITPQMLERAPRFRAVAERVAAWLRRAPMVVAHNLSFDKRFVRAELERVGLRWPADLEEVCTVREAKQNTGWGLLETPGGKHKLGLVAEALGIEVKEAHRAGDDARVCGEVLLELDRRRRLFGAQGDLL